MKTISVLVIEDELAIRRFLKASLEANSLKVIEASTGSEGLALAAYHKPDLILVDIGLPDTDGFDIIRRLREWYLSPIIVLTVHDQEDEKVRALDLGANDYLTKPFGVPELLARIRVCLRRPSADAPSDAIFRSGSLEMDRSAHIVKVQGKQVHLTVTEYNLLAVLIKHAGKVVTHRMLLNEVWGPNSIEHIQYLRVYLGHIRRKLAAEDSEGQHIVTEPGVGYRLRIE